MVAVPVTGEYLVRDGKTVELIEVEMIDSGSPDYWAYKVFTDPQEGDDDV